MKRLNLGIVGVGYFGPNYARVLRELDQVNLSWVCDISEPSLLKFSKIYPHVQTSTKLKPLLNDPNLNGVIIVTPAQYHFDIGRKLILSGKDILVEKPLTDNLNSSQKLVDLAKKNDRVLMVDHTFVFNSAINKLKELITKQSLGKIYHIYGNYNALGPIRRDVSSMWDLPHFIYVVNHILDMTPLWVQAAGKSYLQKGMEDVVFLTLEYPGDILFHLNCSWIDPIKVRKLVVVGEKKMVLFDDMESEEKIKIYNKGVNVESDPNFANLSVVVRHGDTLIPKLELVEPLRKVTETFIKSIRTRKNGTSNGEDGLNLVKVLHHAQKSLNNSGKRIQIK